MLESGCTAILLGNSQDAGYPSAGCRRNCCNRVRTGELAGSFASSLAIIDVDGNRWLIDATPDFPRQLELLDRMFPVSDPAPGLAGILLTHAHIGHYTGLMHLGREVLGTKALPVYAMPRMREFLRSNGPWSQLVELGNIDLPDSGLEAGIQLGSRLGIRAIRVPHRAEFSETVAYEITGPNRKLLYLPDIDNWRDCHPAIEELIDSEDFALLDGTFLDANELGGRDMSEIPHPTVRHSMQRFSQLTEDQRRKVHFIHLNHTNPLLDPASTETREVIAAGFQIGRQGQQFLL